jgi:hypothetical protein
METPKSRRRDAGRLSRMLLLAAVASGCSQAGEGTVKIAPEVRNRGTDPVTKPKRAGGRAPSGSESAGKPTINRRGFVR